MANVSDLWKMPCMVWKTQIPVVGSPCDSPKFFLFGSSEWALWFTFHRESDTGGSDTGTYTIFLLRGNRNERNTKILLTGTTKERMQETFNVTTFIQDPSQESAPLLSSFKTVEYTKDELWSCDTTDISDSIRNFRDCSELKIVCLFHLTPGFMLQWGVDGEAHLSDQYGSHLPTPVNDNPDLQRLSLDLRNLLEDKEYADVKLECGGQTFLAHRSILATRSEYFAAMFRNKMVESETGGVDIPDLEADVLEALLKYLYSGKIPDLSEETSTSIYAAADKYAVHGLKKACCQWMVGVLTKENCMSYLELADEYSDEDFKKLVVDFVAENLHLVSSESWCAFKQKHPRLSVLVYDKRFEDLLSKQIS